jgi:SAM-dependent methyltransferase
MPARMAGSADVRGALRPYNLGMPHDDVTRPSLSARFGASIYDPFLALGERRGMAGRRRELLAPMSGRVLELGAGTGLNVAHYPAAVTELVLTEPDAGMCARLRRRVAASPRDATVVHAAAEELPFADGSFDAVVSTMVLCTVGDTDAALREVRRVLRPGGRLLFIEHIRSSTPRLARWQDRLATPWAAFGAGCRCNQPTIELLTRGGLEVESLADAQWRGMPAIVRPLAVGRARVAEPAGRAA